MGLVFGAVAACNPEPVVPTVLPSTASPTAAPIAAPTVGSTAAPPPISAATPGLPGATLCADLNTLVEAARKNFPDLRRKDRPVSIEHTPGFEATFVLPNTTACRILTSEAPYPDAYECDLAKVTSHAQAREVIERWATVVATCPVVARWKATPPDDMGRSWAIETGDNHELVVRLFTAGDDKARPTLVVRRNEI